jgi:hypothetical protein
VGATAIGRIVAGAGLRLQRPEGGDFRLERAGFEHFAGGAA